MSQKNVKSSALVCVLILSAMAVQVRGGDWHVVCAHTETSYETDGTGDVASILEATLYGGLQNRSQAWNIRILTGQNETDFGIMSSVTIPGS